jgi:hypothetical protein
VQKEYIYDDCVVVANDCGGGSFWHGAHLIAKTNKPWWRKSSKNASHFNYVASDSIQLRGTQHGQSFDDGLK